MSRYNSHNSRGDWNSRIFVGISYANPYLIAVTVLNGLFLLALLVIAGWAVSAHNKSRGSIAHAIFKIHKFWLAIILAILYYAFRLAYLIVTQFEFEVVAAYVLVSNIFAAFVYFTDVALLAIIYGLIFQLLQQPGTGYPRHRGILYAHYAFCGVLLILSITILGLTIRDLYAEVFDGQSVWYGVNGRPLLFVLDVTFDALYACASLEVLIISVSILNKHRSHPTNKKIATLLVTLIALPTLIRHFCTLGYNISAEFLYTVNDGLATSIAVLVIYGLSWVLIFLGLVAVGSQPETSDFTFDLENSRAVVPEGQYEPAVLEKGLGRNGNRITEWRPSLPNWRKGGKSGLGLGTGF